MGVAISMPYTEDLSEAANFPVMIDGTIFRDNPDRMFIGGNQHQRLALLWSAISYILAMPLIV